ncbi:hypothetical protein ACQP2T_63785 (plasmid) [Nonomuraea sp. CA-143628]|uniref:hypothetical protein n=1 Tax=Nonomuraea sp. CA-143628 TaxID=3239997 RepID=UPI003D8C2F4C
MTADQMFAPPSTSIPEFTPDTIEILKNVRAEAVGKAEKAMEAHKQWMNRATQWDDLIRRAEAYAERPELSWQHQNDMGAGEDNTALLPPVEQEPAS